MSKRIYELRCKLVLIANRKSHVGSVTRSRSFKVTNFGTNRKPTCDLLLVNDNIISVTLNSVTLNALKRRNDRYLAIFYGIRRLWANNVQVYS